MQLERVTGGGEGGEKSMSSVRGRDKFPVLLVRRQKSRRGSFSEETTTRRCAQRGQTLRRREKEESRNRRKRRCRSIYENLMDTLSANVFGILRRYDRLRFFFYRSLFKEIAPAKNYQCGKQCGKEYSFTEDFF